MLTWLKDLDDAAEELEGTMEEAIRENPYEQSMMMNGTKESDLDGMIVAKPSSVLIVLIDFIVLIFVQK